jgi:hypothetical protein
MKIMADHDVQGQVFMILQVCRSEEWQPLWSSLDATLHTFASLGLSEDCSDLTLWQACQDHEVILITGNRNQEGPDSLESTLRTHNQAVSLPVITIASPQRILRSRDYATRTAIRLLDYLMSIEERRGAGRLFIP